MIKNTFVSGFTFIKNGLNLGYPIKESIESIAPLCQEIIINVGFDDPNLVKDDGTYEFLRDHFQESKYIFLKSYWDPTLTKSGLILSQQTNLALEKCKGAYCQYIQGDEVLHEQDLPIIENSIRTLDLAPHLHGLVFNYIHFYGNVNIIKQTRNVYRREVRLIRNGLKIKSWLDAQGFRHQDNSKLLCSKTSARIFHYGWARKSQIMANKVKVMDKLYHGADFKQKNEFEYQRIWGLKPFQETHPAVMKNWIETHKNEIDLFALKRKWELKDLGLMISDALEAVSGYRMGEYKNYKLFK